MALSPAGRVALLLSGLLAPGLVASSGTAPAAEPVEWVRVELLPGIVDLEGMPLAPRPGRAAVGEVVDVLRYGTEGD